MTDMASTSGAQAARGLVSVSVRPRRFHLLVLVVVAVPLLFTAQGLELLDPDEGLYADIAQAMAVTGDWVLPRFNGLPYLEKPPLYFWLGGLALAVQPGSEVAVRLWSALSALGTVLLAWRMGRRLYGPEAGLAAGLVLATTVGYALYVRKASTDFVFVFCLTLALYGFLRDVTRPRAGKRRFLVFYAGSALALLSKGLIGLAFPVLVVALTLLWVRGLGWRQLNLARGTALFAALAVPWHAAVAWREPGLFWFYVVDNQILRFLNLRAFLEDDVPVGTLAFIALTFIWFFPWSVFVLARPAPATTPEARWRVLMVVWIVVVLVFFAASRSKLEYYALPAFPALAVMVGAGWASGRDIGRWLAAGVAGCVVVGLAALVGGARLTPDGALAGLAELNVYYRILREQGQPPPFASVQPFAFLLQALGAALVAGWSLAGLAWWRGWRRTAFGAVTATAVMIAVLVVQLLHVVEPHHSAAPVSAALMGVARPGDVVAVEGSLEYSAALPFYTGRRFVVVNGQRGDLDIASRRPDARGWFLDTAGLARQWQGDSRVLLVTQRALPHSALAAVPASSVHLLGRYGSRWLYSNRGN
jgi:4-amino-4-deoxy-L-arabinose transferase-like glycosyltransferase